MQGERGAVAQSDAITGLSDLDGLFLSDLIAGREKVKGSLMSVQKSMETNSHDAAVLRRCPLRALIGVSIDAPPGPASYSRMFPDLPSFRGDDQFLHALGRAGGICDCGN